MLGPVSGVKVGRAKCTCISQAGAQLTPPGSRHTIFSDSLHMEKPTEGKNKRAYSGSGHLSDELKNQ